MSLIPTTGHGLVYPTSAGNTNLWEHLQNLAESVEAAMDSYEAFNSWTLAWDTTGGGGFTSVGGLGQSQGFYSRIGNFVHAEFRVELASGFTVDTGTFVLNLPVAAYVWNGSGIQATLGTWTARDDSSPNHWSGSLGVWAAGATSVSFNGAWDGTSSKKRIDSNDPIVWAANDVLSGVLNYRAA